MAGLVDDIEALGAELLESASADDRAIGDRLREIIDRYEVPVTPLDANMGPATHSPGHTTERTAALLAMPRAGTIRAKIIEKLYATTRQGLSAEQLAQRTGIYLYSLAPRIPELVRMGWVEDTGLRGDSSRGRDVIFWALTDDGRRKWAER